MTALAFNPILHDQPDAPVDIGWETDVFSSQPQYAAQIDWSNPIAAKLDAVVIPFGGRVRVETRGAVAATKFCAPTGTGCFLRPTQFGLGVSSNAGTSDRIRLSSAASGEVWQTLVSEGSFFCVLRHLATPQNTIVFCYGNNASEQYGLSFIGGSLAARWQGQTAAVPLLIGERQVIVGNKIGGTLSAYQNGKLVSSTPAGSNSFAGDAGMSMIGYFNTVPGRGYVGEIFLSGVSRTPLSDAEIKSISANPWQIFKKRRLKASTAASLPKVNFLRNLQRTTQPQYPTQVDWSNPITRGLVFAYNAASGLDAVRGSQLSAVGTPTYAATPHGLASVAAGASRRSIGRNISPASPFACTMVAVVSVISLANNQWFINTSDNTNYSGVSLGMLTTGAPYIQYGNNAGSDAASRRSLVANTTYPIDRPLVLVGGFLRETTGSIWANGSPLAFTANGTAVGYSAIGTTSLLHSGASGSGGIANGNSRISLCAVIHRALTDSEIRSISNNPWQIFV